MAQVIKPPSPLPGPSSTPMVFLAGSIEMDRAHPWQSDVEARWCHRDVIVLNPRRDSWDASWEQCFENPEFRAQVQWELDGLDRATLVLLYLDPGTRSPISLLELGLLASSGRLLVACPEGFWRRGNVEVVCRRHEVPFFADLESLMGAVEERLDAQ
jgi:hypothetical protein